MTGQQLKNSILQLAVQGKLVPQDPADEPASVLLERIREEKEQLIREKKIKREKNPSQIFRGDDGHFYERVGKTDPVCIDEELPFEIPESWEWARLGTVVHIVSARRVHQADWRTDGIPFYRAREIGKLADHGFVDNELFISEELFNKVSASGIPKPNDLMVTAVGTLGKTYIVKDTDHFYYKDASVLCLENFANISAKYLKILFDSPWLKDQIHDNSSGTTVGTLTIIKANNYLVPLPPLAEQQRIVAKIEELLPFVAHYEQSQNKLEKLNTTFPDQLKKSILQEAVQGKLVPQDPADEPASALLERIRTEKKQLIKDGKIKREKNPSHIFRGEDGHFYERVGNNEPVCIDDQLPFEIPETWEWARIGNIFNVGTGMTPLKSESRFYENGTVPWITSSLTSKRYITEPEKCITNYAINNTSLVLYPAHTLIVAMYGQGKTRGQVSELLIDATINQACAALGNIINEEILISYTYFFFSFTYELLRKKAEGTSQPNLNLNKIKETLIPLPPLAEQQRIAEKLGQLDVFIAQLTKS